MISFDCDLRRPGVPYTTVYAAGAALVRKRSGIAYTVCSIACEGGLRDTEASGGRPGKVSKKSDRILLKGLDFPGEVWYNDYVWFFDGCGIF